MRTLSLLISLAIAGPVLCAEPDPAIDKLFESKEYTVTWGDVPKFDATAELEIGEGDGHGQTLNWLRFIPGRDGVEVLSIAYRHPLKIKSTRMNQEVYRDLLKMLAIVDSAKLKPVKRRFSSSSSRDFWVSAYLSADKKALCDWNWAGYDGSTDEIEYAKAQAAVTLAQESAKDLKFKDRLLTEAEKEWIGQKLVRDWKRFKPKEKEPDFHWWVKDRYLTVIETVGDASVLPGLREIIRDNPDDRSLAHAITTTYRILKKRIR